MRKSIPNKPTTRRFVKTLNINIETSTREFNNLRKLKEREAIEWNVEYKICKTDRKCECEENCHAYVPRKGLVTLKPT